MICLIMLENLGKPLNGLERLFNKVAFDKKFNKQLNKRGHNSTKKSLRLYLH